ncbi:MAG: hypothetical protein EZS28_030981, partial [Streblomastix strix]
MMAQRSPIKPRDSPNAFPWASTGNDGSNSSWGFQPGESPFLPDQSEIIKKQQKIIKQQETDLIMEMNRQR